MSNSILLNGQWMGHFTYGSEYGEELNGEKVQFRLFIEWHENGQFRGKSIDLEGIGANFEIAQVKGFLQENFISFTKEYPHFYGVDENGRISHNEEQPHPVVCYEGQFDEYLKIFRGEWELEIDIKPFGEDWAIDVYRGTWEIRRDD